MEDSLEILDAYPKGFFVVPFSTNSTHTKTRYQVQESTSSEIAYKVEEPSKTNLWKLFVH